MEQQRCIAKATELARNAKLKKIHLWRSSCSRDISFKPKKADITIEIEVSPLNSDSKNVLPFGCRFDITGVDKDSNKKAFEVSSVFCVVYAIREDYSPTAEEIEAFGATSAVFNAWPYVREHAQSATVKMDLPAYVLEPVTISQLAKATISDKDDPQA